MAKILIVDDHPTNRELLVTLLGYKGHVLFEAADGEQGLAIAQAERPDMIITDIVMPRMDGYELARQVRTNPLIRETQIIFYTSSYIVSETRVLAKACGVSIIIGKPIEPEALLQQVEDALMMSDKTVPVSPPLTAEFHQEHMRVLTDKLVSKVDELEAEIFERKRAEEALQKSQERFINLFHSSPSAMSLSTAGEGRYLEVNAAFLKIFESTREQVIGHTVFELNTWVDLRQRDALYAALKPYGKVDNFEMALRTRTGKVIELLWSGVRMVVDGQDCLLGSALDITERKQAEKQIAQLNRLYATLSQVNQTIVRVTSHHELYQSICNVAVEYGGFALVWVGLLDEATGDVKPVAANGLNVTNWPLETVNTKQGPFTVAPIATALRTSRVVTSEEIPADQRMQNIHFRYQNHTYLSAAAVPFRLRGKTIGVISLVSDEEGFFKSPEETRLLEEMGLDVSFALDTIENDLERKEVGKALGESEERLRQVWESTSDAMVLSDANGVVLDANPAYLKLYGYSAAQVIGHSFSIIFPQEEREQAIEQYKAVFNDQLTLTLFESEIQRADGTRRTVESSITFIKVDGQRTAMLSTIHDITERRQAQDDVLASEKRYRGLFEDSPISIWEEDFSLVKQHIDILRKQGISDFREYFASHIEEIIECASRVKVTNVNKAALQMYEAESAQQMLGSLREVITANMMTSFQEELITIAEGKTAFQWEGTDRTQLGKSIEVNLNWSVSPGHESDYSKVIVSTIDITERKMAQEKTRLQIERLKALRIIDIAISSSFNLKLTLEVLLSQVISMLEIDATAVLLFHPITKTLEYVASRGFHSTNIHETRLGLGDGYAGRAILERATLHIPNLSEETTSLKQMRILRSEDFIDYHCAPLIVKGEVKGALEVFRRSPMMESPEWLDFLETLAGQTAIAIENSQLFDRLQRSNIELSMAYDATIEGWSHALDLRDKETEGHSQRVTDLTVQLAQAMGIGELDLVNIRRGALLHDIGKMGVPDNILLKPGKLTDEEWEKMRQHPGFAYEMLSNIDYLKPALDIPYCHHEKWDGSGYPRRLKGPEIPLAARLFAVVDVWDALRSDRSYRAGWPEEKALEHINSESGKHFDPQVVEAFMKLISEA
jgi:PAS domain S-box-containing protein